MVRPTSSCSCRSMLSRASAPSNEETVGPYVTTAPTGGSSEGRLRHSRDPSRALGCERALRRRNECTHRVGRRASFLYRRPKVVVAGSIGAGEFSVSARRPGARDLVQR